eukprot:CAMPEP_0113943822 /NCGR_PEP_ID=MMETSP1339-20121228/28243_1 /TAXON_ID=94617 /ORGANISM="Fibrocapsa japonica" /LENGTH=112 /DNA_ID=CAMNT_0000948785 /DNA_START=58 /DNA_END=393 /DNA_ORIENTATION=- /assembly_acc=CAM_ASM_000762
MKFSNISLLFAHFLFIAVDCQHLPVPPLPYDYDALEPFMDESTVRLHHLSHHAAATNQLNAALATLRSDPKTKPLAKMGIDRLLRHLEEVPDPELRDTLRMSGGSYVNHELF